MRGAVGMRTGMNEGTLLQGRYRIQRRLGTGGMASVWRADDEILGRTVAVKVLDGRSLEDAHSRARLSAEARILARLNHPRIAAVYDFGVIDDDIPYLVMELVEGETLSALIHRGGIPWRLAVTICAQVAEALDAAHERGLVHRDVSPSNIIWTRQGVKVIDFGLCASAGDPEETDGLLGTPAYMAPERIEGGPVRPASDMYALGVVLYRTLTNRLPWPAESVMQLLGAHRALPPEPIALSGVPASVVAACERCLAKDPADRPSAAELARALNAYAVEPDAQNAVADEPTAADFGLRTVPIARPRKDLPRPVAMAASAIGLAALVGLATIWIGHSGPSASAADTAADQVSTEDCHVDYRLTQDTGKRFTATISVRNTGEPADPGWRLVFGLPGDQSVDPKKAKGWTQSDGVIRSQPQPAPLATGTSTDLAFAGQYAETNPFPTTFMLGDRRCSASLLGVTSSVVPVTVVAPQNPPKAAPPSGKDSGGRGPAGHGDGPKKKDKPKKGKG